MRIIILLALSMILVACSAKKIVARNCEKTGTSELYVCDPL